MGAYSGLTSSWQIACTSAAVAPLFRVSNHDFKGSPSSTSVEDTDEDCLEAFVLVFHSCIKLRSSTEARLDTTLAPTRLANRNTCTIYETNESNR
jgi:hypothetical protein